jgi:hypothetical protein
MLYTIFFKEIKCIFLLNLSQNHISPYTRHSSKDQVSKKAHFIEYVLAKSSTSVNEPKSSSYKGMFDPHEQLICVV